MTSIFQDKRNHPWDLHFQLPYLIQGLSTLYTPNEPNNYCIFHIFLVFHKASFDVNSGFTFFWLLVLNQLAIKQACWKRTQLIESFLEKKNTIHLNRGFPRQPFFMVHIMPSHTNLVTMFMVQLPFFRFDTRG